MKKRLGLSLNRIAELVRWDEWAHSKAPFVALAYLLLSLTHPLISSASVVFSLLIFTCLYLAFGYVFNDWIDRTADRQAGKTNFIGSFSRPRATAILLGLMIAGPLSLGPLLLRPDVLWTVLLGYLLAIGYSVPIIRLKERGIWGLLSASLAQRTFPVALLLVVATSFSPVMAALYLILVTIVGLRWMVTHQLADHSNDLRTQTKTFSTRAGYHNTERWLPRSIAAELLLIGLLVALTALTHHAALLIPGAYALITAVMTRASGESPLDMLKRPATAYLVLADWYFIYWPIGLALVGIGVLPGAIAWAIAIAVWQRNMVSEHTRELSRSIACLRRENLTT